MLLGLFETSLPYGQVLLILTVLFGFYMAWNIGANDVANAMGTSGGSGALTIKKAVIHRRDHGTRRRGAGGKPRDQYGMKGDL